MQLTDKITTIMTPMKAIRQKCMECSYNNPNEIKMCVIHDCALYPFRMGRNPYKKPKDYTPEQKEMMRQRGLELARKRKEKLYNSERNETEV